MNSNPIRKYSSALRTTRITYRRGRKAMAHRLFLIILAGLILPPSQSRLIRSGRQLLDDNPYNATFQSIPIEEQKYFVAYNLALTIEGHHDDTSSIPKDYNIPEDLYNKFKEMDMPSDFPEKMTEWIRDVWKIPDNSLKVYAKGDCYCYTPDDCVDLGDSGCCCCFLSSLPPEFQPTKKPYDSCY